MKEKPSDEARTSQDSEVEDSPELERQKERQYLRDLQGYACPKCGQKVHPPLHEPKRLRDAPVGEWVFLGEVTEPAQPVAASSSPNLDSQDPIIARLQFDPVAVDFVSLLATEFTSKPLFASDGLCGTEPIFEGIELSVRDKELIVRRIRKEIMDSLISATAQHAVDRGEATGLGDNLVSQDV